MSTLCWLLVLGAAVTILGAPSTEHPSRLPQGPSWFDILPTLTQSQKQRTRLQQTRKHGAPRYGHTGAPVRRTRRK